MHLESREELIEEEDEMIKFMSGLEGYIDQIEIDADELMFIRQRNSGPTSQRSSEKWRG